MLPNHTQPSENDAIAIIRNFTGEAPVAIKRFTTGTGHWVYEIQGDKGSQWVVRLGLASQSEDFLGALHWSQTLRPLGIPLPALWAHGEQNGFPFLVLERLKGLDLGQVYSDLSLPQRQAIAEAVCDIQNRVGTLPKGSAYGYIRRPGAPGLSSWQDVVQASLNRSRERILRAGLVSLHSLDHVAEHLFRFEDYFAQIQPVPFLDDITTKNVLIHAGQLSGIVDVDWLCYGDPLYTIALTRTALLSMQASSDYTDHWCHIQDLSQEEYAVIDFYTALFCVDFLSEFGQVFNQSAMTLDVKKVAQLEQILHLHLKKAK